MSADDAIFIQLNSKHKLVAQWGTMSSDELPDPERVEDVELFYDTLPTVIYANMERANETEYGFRFCLDPERMEALGLSTGALVLPSGNQPGKEG